LIVAEFTEAVRRRSDRSKTAQLHAFSSPCGPARKNFPCALQETILRFENLAIDVSKMSVRQGN
jgi:hypothetical protein